LKKDQLRALLFEERKTFAEMCQGKGYSQAEKDELKKSLAGIEIDSEKESIVVKTIFKKGCTEKLFVGFYANLCSDIVSMEL
jgi:hypothetical protein